MYIRTREANAMWSLFFAAAVTGLVVLGQRWQQERWQLLQLMWQSSISSEMNRGFPLNCGCGERITKFTSSFQENPGRSFFRCETRGEGWLEILLWFRRWLTKEDSEPNENAEGELDLRSDAAKDTLWS
ncbi:hypothetical protein F2Q69_00010795 [Brassica cretica]|uniref:GRF-type domain-containing protein n=1 Tax=Brassica cretica TaxID=69181 RepID=A0A8S9R561_BRACR|nr:hypothetical protein F2Q69_00010795 [Brassica cretica]